MDYWLGILGEQVDTIVEKAIASEGNSPGAQPAQASGQRWSKGISDPSLHSFKGRHDFMRCDGVQTQGIRWSTLGGISGTEANLVSTSTCTVPSLSDNLHHNGADLCGAETSGLSMWRQSTDHQSSSDAAGGRRRARAFGRALAAHLAKMRIEPGAYGRLGLSDLFEMREECLREFGFSDVYR